MASVNPILALILGCGRGTALAPGDPAKAAELLDLCVTQPDLLNTRVNSTAPQLPLDTAAYWGHWPAVQALVEAGHRTGVKPQTFGGGSVLAQAAFSTNPLLVQWTWDTGLDRSLDPQVGVNAVSATTADDGERLQVVQFLIAKGLKVSQDMAVLAAKRSVPVASFLVTSGSLTTDLMGLVEARVQVQDHPFTYALLPDKSNILYKAIHDRSLVDLRVAIDAGNPINIRQPGATRLGTPLHYACMTGFMEGCQALLDKGADPSLLSSYGQSIVGAAVLSDSLDVLQLAVSVAPPAAVNTVDHKAMAGRDVTPLTATIVAMKSNAVPIVEALLAAGANPKSSATAGVPVAFWPSYVLQDVHASTAAGFTRAKARDVILALAAGNNRGQRADLDEVNPIARTSARALAASMGIVDL